MNILVCGGRHFHDQKKMFDVLTKLANYSEDNPLGDPIVIIHGGAQGADSLAGIWAAIHHKTVRVFRADWEKYGKQAGPIRNKEMLEKNHVDLVVAFPGGKGTGDMKWRAREKGIRVMEVE
jgi:hypothetical protein